MTCPPKHPTSCAKPHPRPIDVRPTLILHDVRRRRPTFGEPAETALTLPQLPPLPGGRLILLDPAPVDDFNALRRFHYARRRPATFARVVAIRFIPHPTDPTLPSTPFTDPPDQTVPAMTAAVGVLSHPVPCCAGRERAFGLIGASYARRIAFANAHVRTISRVIVHPAFRSLGLSVLLIRRLIERCPTRFCEALARMGRAHPLFDRAGMTRVPPRRDDEPVYFFIDRHNPKGDVPE